MADKLTRQKRLKRVRELIGKGMMNYQIEDQLSEEWGLAKRTINRYLQQVYSFLRSNLSQNDKEKILLEYNELIQRYDDFDTKLALQYRIQRDKILGLITTRMDLTSKGEKITSFNFGNINENEDTDTEV